MNTLTVFPASDEPARYRFTITGEFEEPDLDPGDTIEEQTASGRVQAASDTYRFTGEITEFTSFGGPVRLELNGEPVDPDELGDGDDGNTTDGNTTSVASGPAAP